MVTPCRALATYAVDHVGISRHRVRVVHNGIDPRWAAAPTYSPAVAGRPPAPPLAAWLGVMQPVKRVPELVRAAAAVPGLRLHLIGDGPERPRVEQAIAATDTADRIEALGFCADPAPRLAEADLLVLPSAAEACPMAVLQAMASGLPVIASRVGGVAEVVRDGVDGLLLPAGDDAALRLALQRLATDVSLRRRLGASAQARARERFSLARCTADLIAVYEELA